MASGKQSLKQAHRKRIIREVRARGHSNRNLWYVYSVKLKQDLVLSSDLALVYWIVFLEIDLDVVSFRQSEGSETFDFLVQKRSGDLVEVELSNLEESANNSSKKSVRLPSVQIMKEAPFAIKIMKALAFAAAIRSLDCVAASNAVRAIEVSLGEGDIKSVLSKAPLVAPPIICGVLVRHFIAGHIEIDFAGKPSFGYHTQWKCRS